ncbi:MAG: response regulator, partial [Candidatus Omnitrophica bacterium]|nr:response regulator [Candidatus Omnitrophota bacterium]
AVPKLLIVDDEIDVREFAGNFFRKRGIQVLLASSGAEALRIIAAERPDLVLLDIRMEEMSGIEVLRKVRSSGDQTRIIMVSGVEDDTIVAEAKSAGVLAFVHKPLVLEELQNIVLREIGPHP